MLRMLQSVGLVNLCTSAIATANARELLGRPGQTVALGAIGASVYHDETGGNFRLVTTIAKPLGGIPIRLVASLELGQGISLSVPAQAGKPVTEVRLMHTQGGLNISYPAPATN